MDNPALLSEPQPEYEPVEIGDAVALPPAEPEGGLRGEIEARALAPFPNAADWHAIGLGIIAEILTLVFGGFAWEITANARVGSMRNALDIWTRWDAPHYLNIAVHGYQNTGDARFLIVFYPLYPWLIRIVLFALRDPLVSAFVVSTAASIVAAVSLQRLVAMDYGEDAGYRAIFFLFVFPTAYFLHIAYTESVFLALAITSFLAARRNRWFSASVIAAFACLSRTNGLLVLPALGVEALHQMWAERRWRWNWLWLALVPLGFGVYLVVNYRVTGNPFMFRKYELEHWSATMTWPWIPIRAMFDGFFWREPIGAQMIGLQISLYIGLALLATLVSFFVLRPSYIVWMLGNSMMIACLSWDLSAPRYDLALFPMFIIFARLGRNRECYAAITFWSLLSMGIFTAHFVRGWWAF